MLQTLVKAFQELMFYLSLARLLKVYCVGDYS